MANLSLASVQLRICDVMLAFGLKVAEACLTLASGCEVCMGVLSTGTGRVGHRGDDFPEMSLSLYRTN